MAGIYIHIPFCKTRCIYCDFYSTTRLEERDTYVDSLISEIQIRSKEEIWKNKIYTTIYFGGGTPSQLSALHFQRITDALYENFTITNDAEFTVEANPDDLNNFTQILSLLPINRISMGIQSFNDKRLRMLGRRHSAQQARDAVKICKDTGIHNLSIDLMFGFPEETLDEWESDIDNALRLGVQHISTYSLMYEPGTKIYNMLHHNEIKEINEGLSNQMYLMLCEKLKAAGYEHYEISNFALPHFRSLHNSGYWSNTPYIGFGAKAHSYDGDKRSWNGPMQGGRYEQENEEILTLNDKYNENIMTRLRTCEGIKIHEINSMFGATYTQHLLKQLQSHIKQENICIDNNLEQVKLTRKGILISNLVMSDLMK